MKPIKLSQKQIEAAKNDILSKLDSIKLQGTKVNFSYDFTDLLTPEIEIKKPLVYMNGNTYLKMLSYVTKCDQEIAWHGTVTRGEKEKGNFHHFYISDVFLYPQEITGTTVRTDQTTETGMPLYNKWAESLSDEIFNTMRFQGHSHVNMGASPSGTDEANKNEFLQDLMDNDFYIFLIMNKKQEVHVEVYDLAQNMIFEKADVTFQVYLGKDFLLDMVDKEIEQNIKKQVYTHGNTTSINRRWRTGFGNYSNNYDGYDGYEDDYYKTSPYYQATNNKSTVAASKKTTIKKHCVIMNRNGRDFEKEHREYEGEIINARKNGKNFEIFVPYKAFYSSDVTDLRKDGWHVQEFEIPEEYDL